MFWTTNEADLTKEVKGGSYINKSGIYTGKIIESNIIDSKSSSAQALVVVLESEEGKSRLTFWYKKADGTENEYARTNLNRLLFLTKTKNSDLKLEVKDNKKFVPVLLGKEIGAIIEVKAKDEENVDYNLKDWFEIKSKKTADEIKNNHDAKNVAYWTEKFKNAQPIITKKKDEKTSNENVEVEEEFPF